MKMITDSAIKSIPVTYLSPCMHTVHHVLVVRHAQALNRQECTDVRRVSRLGNGRRTEPATCL